MNIKVSELRKVANLLFDHLERSGHLDVEVERDFYWNIPEEKLYSMYEEPSAFTAGQLSDDWRELQKFVDGQRPPVAYGLVWLASLLRSIGSRIVS